MRAVWGEFREFAFKGNVVDLAIAVVLGGAFGAIITSFVTNLINPLIGLLLGGTDLTNLFVVLKDGDPAGPYRSLDAAQAAGAAALAYGAFLNAVINFLLIALVLFFVIKAASRFQKAEEPDTAACPFCLTEVPLAATRCPACTSDLAASPSA